MENPAHTPPSGASVAHAVIVKFPGTNCDTETARALEMTGFTAEVVPFGVFTAAHLDSAQLLVFAGGFSYGDYVMAGRLARLEVEQKVGNAVSEFRDRGGYILGICNGFQILTQLGLLPTGSLIDNINGRFQCRWAMLKNHTPSNAFLKYLPQEFELPIAHAEGRFVVTEEIAADYLAKGLATLTYSDDINGSTLQIAGMQDETGRVFGLMPHPERFMRREHHYDQDWAPDSDGNPTWADEQTATDVDPTWGWGYYFFKGIHQEIEANSACAAL